MFIAKVRDGMPVFGAPHKSPRILARGPGDFYRRGLGACPGWESNPHGDYSPKDFKSSASAVPPPGRVGSIRPNKITGMFAECHGQVRRSVKLADVNG
jgi:hypothetical protein